MIFSNFVFGGQSNDIIAEIIKLKKRMEDVEGTVVRVVEREEKTEKKVDAAMNKIDEKLDLLVGKIVDLNTVIGEVKSNIKNQTEDMKNQFGAVDKKMMKIE